MARPSPSCAHDDDRLCLSPASPPCRSKAEKKESAGRHLSRHYPPCATPSSNSSLDHRRRGARIAENGFAASSGVSKSAKVVLALESLNRQILQARGVALSRLCQRDHLSCNELSQWVARIETKRLHDILI